MLPLLESAEGVRAARGSAIVANAEDPPFLASSFSTVAIANVLDSCRDPFTILAQADALVAPMGRLLVSCAYAFQAEITPIEARFSENDLSGALHGNAPFGPYRLDSRCIENPLDLRWILKISPRTTHQHRVQCFTAQKPG